MKKVFAALLAMALCGFVVYSYPSIWQKATQQPHKTIYIKSGNFVVRPLDAALTGPKVKDKASSLLKYFLPSECLAASFVLSNTGRTYGAQGFIGASPNGLNAGTMELQESDNTLGCTLTLPNPIGSAPTNGVLTFGSISDGTGEAGGPFTLAKAVLKNTAGTVIGTGDVGLASASIIVSTVTLGTGDTVSVVGSITLTVPAGT